MNPFDELREVAHGRRSKQLSGADAAVLRKIQRLQRLSTTGIVDDETMTFLKWACQDCSLDDGHIYTKRMLTRARP
jgi:hypothetical protein